MNGEEIVCTPGHKFYAPEKGWTSAIELRAGDQLQLVNGEYVTVEKVQHELLEEPVKVYNFEVEDFHTYYVGTDVQVLVHNMCANGNSNTEKTTTQAFDIVEYGDKSPDFENHHGVLDVWSSNNIDGYQSRASNSPTIALTPEQHAATKAVYREWLFEKTGKKVGGKVDWTNVSPREIQALSERMFDAAQVPTNARENYYNAFNRYIYGLQN